MTKARTQTKYVLCIGNTDCDDLEKGKVYPVLPDAKAKQNGFIRIIDESGEDYLYPANYFFVIELPQKVERSLRQLSPAAIT